MLVKENEFKNIVNGKECVAVRCSNGYNGKYYNIKEYYGPHGIGYLVENNGKVLYYVNTDTKISKNVYNGLYDVFPAVMNAGILKKAKYKNVDITPTWELNLDTISGDIDFKRVYEYHVAAIGGTTLSICWVGQITERDLRLKIKRVLKNAVVKNKAKLV